MFDDPDGQFQHERLRRLFLEFLHSLDLYQNLTQLQKAIKGVTPTDAGDEVSENTGSSLPRA
jgi:hypothetical protein